MQNSKLIFNFRFRILAFDAGLFSFGDFKISPNRDKNDLFILITNPKHIQFKSSDSREPLRRMRFSTHIRFLVFAKHTIKSAHVYIDDTLIGKANRIVNSETPLFVLKWNPYLYASGVHKLKIVVQVSSFSNSL